MIPTNIDHKYIHSSLKPFCFAQKKSNEDYKRTEYILHFTLRVPDLPNIDESDNDSDYDNCDDD